jgi:hypothetical protein
MHKGERCEARALNLFSHAVHDVTLYFQRIIFANVDISFYVLYSKIRIGDTK